MAAGMMLLLFAIMVATAFLSGLFGMAGGLVLIGVLLAILPLPTAMMLHAITQIASNGWRATLWWRYARWQIVGAYALGSSIALGVWSLALYVPSKHVALILLGVTPFLVRLFPSNLQPDPESPKQGVLYGVGCMSLMLMTGVAGPLLDSFFLGRGKLDRREIIATKGFCQVFGHGVKLAYFGGIITAAPTLDPRLVVLAIAASFLGTTVSKRFLEAMSDRQFRTWTGAIITLIAGYYLLYGGYLFATTEV